MVQTDVMTLTRFMINHTQQNPDQQDLEQLLASIQVGTSSSNPNPSLLVISCHL